MKVKLRNDDKWYKVNNEFTSTITGYASPAYALENGKFVVEAEIDEKDMEEIPTFAQKFYKEYGHS